MGYEDGSLIDKLILQLETYSPNNNAANVATAMAMRYQAANALGFIGSGTKHASLGKSVPALSQALLKDPDVSVRNRAAWALGVLGPDAKVSLPALTIASHDPDTKFAAGWAIARIEKKK
jgi:HEAT repeat protein